MFKCVNKNMNNEKGNKQNNKTKGKQHMKNSSAIVNILKKTGVIAANTALVIFGLPFITVGLLCLARVWKWTTMYLIGLLPF